MINIECCKKLFNEYIKRYDFNNEKIHLKYGHTLRVVDFCEDISRTLNLSGEDIELARLIGLLHDLGRFEQIKMYDTYNDDISIDHASLAIEILQKDNYIDKFVKDGASKKIIMEAIVNHNKFKINDKLDSRTELFAKIIRDADKLDIMNLIVNGKLEITFNSGRISCTVLDSILHQQEVHNTDVNSKIDNYVSSVAFVFDLNFDYSIKYIKDKNLLSILIDNIAIRNDNEKEKLLAIKVAVSEYIKERLGKQNVRKEI